MKTWLTFFLFICFAGLIYWSANYYVGIRTLHVLSLLFPLINIKLYWSIFWFVALSYIFGRLGEKYLQYLPGSITYILTIIGSYWMFILFYLFLINIFVDILRIFDRFFNIFPDWLKSNPSFVIGFSVGIAVLVSVAVIYGNINAKNTQITHYNIDIPKSTRTLNDIHIVMVSDMHLGKVIHNGYFSKMVDTINGMQPDLVLFAGDMIDENIDTFLELDMCDTLSKLKSKYGTYGVLGNHEYFKKRTDDIVFHLEKAGVKILRDNYVQIDNSLYIVGREDITLERMDSKSRKGVDELLQKVDKTLPIILLDHQPIDFANAEKNGVDLQLSGHTHGGQFFPINIIVQKLFGIDKGYLRKGNLQIVVSSGFGTWGPPIRVASKSEIVDITIKTSKK